MTNVSILKLLQGDKHPFSVRCSTLNKYETFTKNPNYLSTIFFSLCGKVLDHQFFFMD